MQENATTWITIKTVYSACSCSSTGKAVATSRPYRSDANGNPNAGEAVNLTTTQFDGLGRPTRVTTPDLNHTDYAYSVSTDPNWPGTLTTITDPLGKQKRYLYDVSGHLVRVEEQNSGGTLVVTARYTYDLMGRMLTAVIGTTTTQTRSWVYNTNGQLTSATNPENQTVTYTYNGDGTLKSKTDAKNQTLSYFYDTNHRLLRIESPLGTVKTSFTYDTEPNTNYTTAYATGKMTSASNDGYTWHYAYDVMGRVNKQTLQTPYLQGSAPFSAQAQYVYDQDGRLTNLKYPGAMAVPSSVQPGYQYAYSYNILGQALTLSNWDGVSYDGGGNPIWATLAQGAAYNSVGQITAWQDGSDLLSRSYDSLTGRVTNIHAWTASIPGVALDLNYSYFADGRASSTTESFNGGTATTTTYTYDQLNRLSTAAKTGATPIWNLSWTYDDFGNRTGQTGSTGTPQMTLGYDPATNRINSSPSGSYSYDANGNLIAMPDGTAPAGQNDSLTYDVFDRVSTVTQSYTANTTTAKYDAFGRRIERSSTNSPYTHIYFYDTGGRLLGEYQGNPVGSGLTRTQGYFAGQRLGQYTDRTGNVRYTPGSGWKHYYPYGEEVTSTSGDAYKFAQLYRDQDTGLDYAGARYYASGMGRFATKDLVSGTNRQSPQAWNAFSYAESDPINKGDPTGLMTCYAGELVDTGSGPKCAPLGDFGTIGGGSACPVQAGFFADPYTQMLVASICAPYEPITIGSGTTVTSKPAPQPCFQPNFLGTIGIGLLTAEAQASGLTVGMGVGASGSIGNVIGFAGGGSVQLVVSPNGQAALTITAPYNPTGFNAVVSPGAGGSAGSTFSYSNASTPQDLAGIGVNASVNTGFGIGGGFDVSWTVGTSGQSVWQITTTLGAGFGAAGSGGWLSYTTVIPVCH